MDRPMLVSDICISLASVYSTECFQPQKKTFFVRFEVLTAVKNDIHITFLIIITAFPPQADTEQMSEIITQILRFSLNILNESLLFVVDKLRNLIFTVSLYCFIQKSGAVCHLAPLAVRLTFISYLMSKQLAGIGCFISTNVHQNSYPKHS
jgi:hypothetical protein